MSIPKRIRSVRARDCGKRFTERVLNICRSTHCRTDCTQMDLNTLTVPRPTRWHRTAQGMDVCTDEGESSRLRWVCSFFTCCSKAWWVTSGAIPISAATPKIWQDFYPRKNLNRWRTASFLHLDAGSSAQPVMLPSPPSCALPPSCRHKGIVAVIRPTNNIFWSSFINPWMNRVFIKLGRPVLTDPLIPRRVCCMVYHVVFLALCFYFTSSEWYLGYPDCGGDRQSPINLCAAEEEIVKVHRTICYL